MTQQYTHLKDGEWFRPSRKWGEYKDACCDCGLVHRVQFRIVDGQVVFRATRDNRSTAAMRRPKAKTRQLIAKRAQAIVARMEKKRVK